MLRRFSLFVSGLLFSALVVCFVRADTSSQTASSTAETYRQLIILGDIFERVRSQYVVQPDEKSLIEHAINGMLNSLDPYSSYLNPQAAKDMRAVTRGEFGGIGIEVTMEHDLIKVISPIDETPAARAGILTGDLIVRINKEEVRGMSLNTAVEKMRGLIKTPVHLSILRKGADKPVEFHIMRDVIKVKAIKFRVERDVGYIKISLFNEKTHQDLEDAIAKIKTAISPENLKGYILDLRLNPGGLLEQAVSVSDVFLEHGKIVSTRGREPGDILRFDAHSGDNIDAKPLIVLINGGSASASEIVAGALQDHCRATVLGTRSFGKGSVQTIIPLAEHGALRLTTALYYTPSGKSIQGKGIIPDILVEQNLPDHLKGEDLTRGESNVKGHIKGTEENKEGSGSVAYVPLDLKEDVQLKYALELLRGQKKDPAFPPDPKKRPLIP